MILRDATMKDYDQCWMLAQRFHAESIFNQSKLNAKGWKGIFDICVKGKGGYGMLVCEIDGVIVGYAMMQVTFEFLEDGLGDLYQFYVSPEYRGTGVSRMLRDGFDKALEAYPKCKYAFVSCASGFDDGGRNDGLFSNLFKAVGFQKHGSELIKVYGDK